MSIELSSVQAAAEAERSDYIERTAQLADRLLQEAMGKDQFDGKVFVDAAVIAADLLGVVRRRCTFNGAYADKALAVLGFTGEGPSPHQLRIACWYVDLARNGTPPETR